MKARDEFYSAIKGILDGISKDEGENLDRAAEIMADAIEAGQLIYVFGTGGHSYICAEEMFYRTGGLVPVNAMLDAGVSLAFGAGRSTWIERLPGYSQRVIKSYGLGEGDVLIVGNAYGINSATIDAAIEGKRLGAKVIAITSPAFSKQIPKDHPARHPSGKNLFELEEVDVVLDNHMPLGDAVVEVEGLDGIKVGPSSTMASSFTINSLVVTVVEKLVKRGVEPPVWVSSNMPGGDEKNAKYLKKYGHVLKHLL